MESGVTKKVSAPILNLNALKSTFDKRHQKESKKIMVSAVKMQPAGLLKTLQEF